MTEKALAKRNGIDQAAILLLTLGEQEAADVLKNTFRAADIVARVGGDEFVALAIVPPADVDTIMKRLHWHLDRFNASAGHPYRLAMSVGVAHFDPGDSQTLEGLVREADEAMYHRKRPQAPES